MPSCSCHVSGSFRLLCLTVLLTGLCLVALGSQPAIEQPAIAAELAERPRLAVLLIFDQMRGDYLERWQHLFGEGGFRRLQTEGAWFQNCHYPYAHTVTAAGHASVATGASPDRHGIVGNDWYDRSVGEAVGCATFDRYALVPPPLPASDSKGKKPKGVSPERLRVPTLADALKEATGGKGRVVSLSGKERSAALPGGRHPDACYWYSMTGQFVTSTYYRDSLHPWVSAFNRSHAADRWFGTDWTPYRPDLDYERYSGPDDVEGEGKGVFQGRTFPHPMTGGLKLKSPTAFYYGAVANSPFGNDLLFDLTKHAVEAEHLGSSDIPDLLCVSFSCNDAVGHCWGPDSQEVLDVTLRSDKIVAELLAHLDAHVGKGRYVLAVTADHGVCPLPEVARSQGKDAGRIPSSMLGAQAEAFLRETFGDKEGKARWIAWSSDPWVYLNQAVLRQRGLKQADVEEALAGWLKKQPGVQTAYTRTQLLGVLPADDELGRRVRKSFDPERSGDVTIVPKPYHLTWILLTGTTHGTPHPYDTHVPLLVYGAGVRSGVYKEAVTPLAAAPILAHALGTKPPADAEVPVPAGLFAAPSE